MGLDLMSHIYKWAHENQKCVLLVTHNMAHAAEFSDYLIRTENGKLRIGEDGHPIDLRGQTTEDKLKFIKKPSLTLKQPSAGSFSIATSRNPFN